MAKSKPHFCIFFKKTKNPHPDGNGKRKDGSRPKSTTAYKKIDDKKEAL